MFIEHLGKSPRVAASAFIAPTATLIGDVIVGEESCIWFGVVLRADAGTIRIGARSAIEDNAVVHASERGSTVIGDDVTVGHGAVLDDCTIENGALVGSNAVILEGAVVGAGTLVAAGSVVTVDEHVPANIVAAGSPARVRKVMTGRAADRITAGTADSLAQARAYLRDNLGVPAHHELKSTSRKKRGGGVLV